MGQAAGVQGVDGGDSRAKPRRHAREAVHFTPVGLRPWDMARRSCSSRRVPSGFAHVFYSCHGGAATCLAVLSHLVRARRGCEVAPGAGPCYGEMRQRDATGG